MKVNDLQQLLTNKNLDGFVFSISDEYLNEYVPECNNRIAYITNFTGSFGVLIVLANSACLFVDSRYTLAAKQQVDLSTIEVNLFSKENVSNWLKSKLGNTKANIAFNAKITSFSGFKMYKNWLENLGMQATLIDYHLVDEIWENRPSKPATPVYLHDTKYGSLDYKTKIKNIALELEKSNLDAFLITALDSIAWLLNIRGNDIPCNPLSLSKLIITKAGKVSWFIDKEKVENIQKLLPEVDFYNESELENFLKNNPQNIAAFGLSNNSPIYYYNLLQNNFKVVLKEDFCVNAKAVKNPNEVNSIKQAHIRDGAYLCKLYYELYQNPIAFNEISIDTRLTELKQDDKLFIGESFPSIVGVDSNGAIVHYRATTSSSKNLTANSYLLLDCGSQYLDGTTDITRTFSFNQVSEDFKKHYTLVLKGHIALATLLFKKGATGGHIDAFARKPLWENGLDYGHGTGHGIGFFLCVHEGPQSISPFNNIELKEGMIISNEPGFYLENQYGIRLENLYVVKKSSFDNFFCLENLTLAPFDIKNIDFSLLTSLEIEWLEKYHKEVYQKISPYLNTLEQNWLKDFMNIN
ncbi:MAG: aminopeptidase P family protein [Alphaproteobacteria bacterium]|jgi:Xaa-Pro aminopeptidase|nr:aminopeptidase P family protein [Alphaproteobacteria bacterium]